MPTKTTTKKAASTSASAVEKPIIASPSSSQIGVTHSNIDSAQVLKAFSALSAHIARRNTTTSSALPLDGPSGNFRDPSNTVFLQLTTTVVSTNSHVKPVRINLPHALHEPEEVSVGLLVKDPQRAVKDQLVTEGIKCISRVVGVTKLKGKFKPYDARRALVQDHDLFLADARIVPTLPNLCGKVFFDARKNPITVDTTKKGDALRKELEGAIKATTYLPNKGTCTTIKLGYLGKHTPQQLTQNLLAVLPAVLTRVKGGWESLNNLDVKTGNSAALPVWTKRQGVKTHVTPSPLVVKEVSVDSPAKVKVTEKGDATPTKKGPSPRKTRSAAAAKAGTRIESASAAVTPVKPSATGTATPRKVASSVSRSARKPK